MSKKRTMQIDVIEEVKGTQFMHGNSPEETEVIYDHD